MIPFEPDENKFEYIPVFSLREHLAGRFCAWSSPFEEKPTLHHIGKNTADVISRLLERILGVALFVEADNSKAVPQEFHALFRLLYREGVLRSYLFPRPIPGWPDIPAVSLISDHGITATGVAYSRAAAFRKAIGELVERTALIAPHDDSIARGTFRELRSRGALDPAIFRAFSETQLWADSTNAHEVDESSIFSWTECRALHTGRRHLIPAHLVYLRFRRAGEPFIRQATSSGAAAGTSFEMAMYNGICEAVERDAFMIHWLNRITPPRIDPESVTAGSIRALLELCRKYNIDIHLLDLTTDLGIPVIGAAIRDNTPGRPVVHVSARCDLDSEAALRTVILDVLRVGHQQSVSGEQILAVREKGTDLPGLEERRVYWCDRRQEGKANFFLRGARISFVHSSYAGAGMAEKFRRIKNVFMEHGYQVFYKDITTAAAQKAGLTVIMSLAPNLYPLYLNERYRYLGVRRLFDAPVRMGALSSPKKEDEMNDTPHPFL
ncbi:MAG: hypothetical protein A3I44_00340 [Candidatus Sungbacteria bacterium RIFCSPLOWO2_02_FULL_51_17]|uniref:YcaO domain-containing protein n=1 Tax=Candidatus Sungbacteria bacterium RIFCSPHIGHO2_02_FULL_51_29 TaxID=1802273 RepID=A0A1G2KPF5_9BACT|nr:MAG: hypothetical protein A2676_04725 [Candidatus Sungbacteria bacterium RIFCSPHIGHO2_01_FULL_51_22]OHA01290.1 MAG: hypothetical protein A3C16_01975 [Candidatus Sungbacteria bacterium RIFCSPHIGHO2_02_FULL_51_29]OHA06481.1 MAG: hypothetical protein A3B29_05480 [Candidatus Sungbacteria bacterium RIFCSPLOWO2_01_FULL_51_34]OHA12543.1 MAG: hypothetical protein A3I44_00340 [Candidatus Sungbacteria bacterium RIFCSPLOWO2_02_FULL_51_17]